jgi:hypothetical protein
VLLGLGFGVVVCAFEGVRISAVGDVERGVLDPGAGGVSLGADVDAAVDGDEGRATGPVLQAANVRVKPASVAAMALVHAPVRFMCDKNPLRPTLSILVLTETQAKGASTTIVWNSTHTVLEVPASVTTT